MKIRYHKNFTKRFQKLPKNLRTKVIASVECFTKNPFDPSLKNHPLKGSMKGKRAFSVTGDIRVVFEEYDGYVVVIMLDVGSHNQVY